MPFANDNAGTIKQRNARAHPALAALSYTSHTPSHSPALSRRSSQQQQQQQPNLGQNHACSLFKYKNFPKFTNFASAQSIHPT
jgi:hypothetical protein